MKTDCDADQQTIVADPAVVTGHLVNEILRRKSNWFAICIYISILTLTSCTNCIKPKKWRLLYAASSVLGPPDLGPKGTVFFLHKVIGQTFNIHQTLNIFSENQLPRNWSGCNISFLSVCLFVFRPPLLGMSKSADFALEIEKIAEYHSNDDNVDGYADKYPLFPMYFCCISNDFPFYCISISLHFFCIFPAFLTFTNSY